MLEIDQRRLLGEFVRAHRERIRPPVPGGRRRTPGLRREELATLAGISVTWCAWIEQGRPVQASPEALSRLAEALSLTRAERAYLFELAGRIDSDDPAGLTEQAPVSLVAAVEGLQYPAYGLDRLWNACCWNGAAANLFCGWLDGKHQRNLLRFVFTDEVARSFIPQWQERAGRLLAEFRADFGHTFRDPRVRAFIDALKAESALFTRLWDGQNVQHRMGGLRTFDHPRCGRLRFDQHSFSPTERQDFKLVLLVPRPSERHSASLLKSARSPA
ncbi:MAG: helix-turn-helix domain-containing protein [Bradyrhizobium sp.]|uniref:helix-turn-helix transcriptional regulator n=1 Tax=Bradyrhizobium sp. TaxID=376 RepID=UPI001E0A721A|nr:helix-turn-helix transcriptional regulator [Bradyrhizobium sp.]MBV9562153.1 helix-turn-helix domain-containing protein [Bradyrhizobium sp.]